MKKGQAAMEFLMTYGWAILVVIAAIAALAYFGVLDPAQLLPDRCQFPAGMDCIGKASIDGAVGVLTVTFALRNNIGFDIDANEVVTTTDTGTCTSYELLSVDDPAGVWSAVTALGTPLAAGVTVRNNDRLQVRLSGCSTMSTGDKYQGTIAVSYVDSNTGLAQKALGEVRGRVA